ncbi:hypothetical protein OKW39_008886 [Paraburkholderia sp. MM6662-R1]
MSTLRRVMNRKPGTLHVFAEDGAWHWGITVPRGHGFGFQVIAYNQPGFQSEDDATSDGTRALERITNTSFERIERCD